MSGIGRVAGEFRANSSDLVSFCSIRESAEGAGGQMVWRSGWTTQEMYTMGQHVGAAALRATAHGILLMRSSQSILSFQSSPPLAGVFHHLQSPHTTTAAPAPAVGLIAAGPVHQLQKLQCSSPGPVQRLHMPSAFSSSCSRSRLPLLSAIPGITRKMSQDRLHLKKSAVDEDIIERQIGTRKIVEHVVFFKMNDSLSEEQEKEMLDSLWSLQYQIKDILCTTVGRLVQKTPEGYTHALFSRFPSKQAVDNYMENEIRLRIAQDLVIPLFQGLIILDFEAEVEDEIESIFRRGDDFQEGVEHFLFFRFKDNVSSDAEDKVLRAANSTAAKFGDLVQLTAGATFGKYKGTYSHGLVARLPSEEVRAEYEKFVQADSSWGEVMELCDPSSTLITSFVVSPIGKTVM